MHYIKSSGHVIMFSLGSCQILMVLSQRNVHSSVEYLLPILDQDMEQLSFDFRLILLERGDWSGHIYQQLLWSILLKFQ